MANRHLARTVVLQTLYEWDFNQVPATEVTVLLSKNWQNFAPGDNQIEFATELIKGTVLHKQELDDLIVKYAPEWPLDQINPVSRNVLRLSIFELNISKKVPPLVAINEAIELAKSFAGPSAGRFVNGVLGSVYQKMIDSGEIEPVSKEEALAASEKAEEKSKEIEALTEKLIPDTPDTPNTEE